MFRFFGRYVKFGSSGDDVIEARGRKVFALSGDDEIIGSSRNETVDGGRGDDTFIAGGGRDYFNGGRGTDSIVLSGSLEDASLSRSWFGRKTIETAEGRVSFRGVEELVFDDFTYLVGENNGAFLRADAATTDEDTAIEIDALGNDFDFEGDAFSITDFDAVTAQGAAVTLNENGTFSYDATASDALQALDDGAQATDSFTYSVTDSAGNVTTQTVTVTVDGVTDGTLIDFDTGELTTDDSGGLNFSYVEDGYIFVGVTDFFGFPLGFGNTFNTNNTQDTEVQLESSQTSVTTYEGQYTVTIIDEVVETAFSPLFDIDLSGDLEFGVPLNSTEGTFSFFAREDGGTFSLESFDFFDSAPDNEDFFLLGVGFEGEDSDATLIGYDGTDWFLFSDGALEVEEVVTFEEAQAALAQSEGQLGVLLSTSGLAVDNMLFTNEEPPETDGGLIVIDDGLIVG